RACVCVAKNGPRMGSVSYEVTTPPGPPIVTIRPAPATSADTTKFSVALNADGTIRSIRDKAANRELVSLNGERAFNDLLRVEGRDASKVVYPVAPKISVRKGVQMTEI